MSPNRYFVQAAAAAALAWACIPMSAHAGAALCPGAAAQGGFNNSFTPVAGPLDGTSCGASNTAVDMAITDAVNYAKLTFSSATTGFPTGLTLGNLAGMSAQVVLDSAADQPYYQLAFVDSTDGLGQTNATDQILFIEFQPTTVVGGNLAVDPAATLFNVYDNTMGFYLQGGQQNAQSLDYWLGKYDFLETTAIDEVRIGLGLAGGSGPAQSVTVDSLTIDQASVPEPGSISLTALGMLALAVGRRRSRRS